MSSWKTVIQWELIKNRVRQALGLEIDKINKEKALKIFEERHPVDDIYELEIETIESELIEILIKIMDKGTKKSQKKKRIFIELKEGTNFRPELNYIAKILEQDPSLKRLFKKRREKDQNDDEEEEDRSSMYI